MLRALGFDTACLTSANSVRRSTGGHSLIHGTSFSNWYKYQLAVDLAQDPQVRAVFEKLRDEEAFHADFLEGEYARLEKALGG